MNMLPGKSNLVAKQNVDTRDITGPDFGSVPYIYDALHYSFTPAIDGELKDRTGLSDRDSVITKKGVGDGSTYIRFADFLSTSLTYYDITLGTEVVTTTDGSGDFVLPTNGVGYIVIDGHTWTFEEITDITTQTSIVSTDGQHIAQFFLTSPDTIQDDYRAGIGL